MRRPHGVAARARRRHRHILRRAVADLRKVRTRGSGEERLHPGHGDRSVDGEGDRGRASRTRRSAQRGGARQYVCRSPSPEPERREERGVTRILVAEDEPGIALGLEDDLRLEGWDVAMVADGPSASKRAREERFDLILLDVMLPGRDGFDVCRELRKAGVKTPIIMLT